MGKKLKGGRRQILQLEEKRLPKVPSNSKMKSLIHYSDSDDDSKKSNDSECYSSGLAQNSDAAPLESQIADFFKEIDALSVPEEASIEPDKVTSFENTPASNSSDTAVDLPVSSSKDEDFSEASCKADDHCPWQEICDSSTGYSYYWNVQTNEVTWDCPPEYAVFIKPVKISTKKTTYAAQSDKYYDEKEKKKKKIGAEVLDGAVIPISYFGNSSSSDNSSDSENELPNKDPKSEKFSELKRNKIVKKTEQSIESSERENNELIGPSLPPNFKFSKANSDTLERSLQMTISQNEIDEVAQVNSSLPPKYLCNVTEKPSQSDFHETPIETTCAASYENEKSGCETLDSTVKRGKNSLNQNAYEGFRAVVEYDNFTDEDEEVCIANISSSKPNRYKKNCEVKCSSQQEQEMIENSNSPKRLLVAQNEISSLKREASETLEESIKIEELIKKPKKSNVNIDNLFASHSAFAKYGFGFRRKNQFDDQNNELDATSTLDYKTQKNRSDYMTVSFVKSEDVLDLKALNDENICDETNHVLPDVSIQINTKCIESNALEQHANPILNDELIMKAPTEESFETPSEYDASSSNIIDIKDIIDCTISKKKKKKDKFHFNAISTSLQVDDDLDEIDRALCEALDAKMSAKDSSLKSSPPISDVSNTSENMLQSTSTQVVEKQKQDYELDDENGLDTDAITDDILEISSELIDKLTFLLSSPCTHASFSGIFFQLQTRFVDWQAGALDSKYFMARLKELEQYIQRYETDVVSGEWTYQWDRENKRYYFINSKTQHSQWTYPEEICNQYKYSWCQGEAGSSSASSFVTKQDDLQTVSSSILHNNSAEKSCVSSLTLESKEISSGTNGILQSPPGVDSPHPPPHSPPSSCAPPLPPPDLTEILREPEDMDIENSNDSSSFMFVNDKKIADDKQILSMVKQSSKASSQSFANTPIFSAVSSTSLSGCEDLSTVSLLSQPISHTFDSSEIRNKHWSQPSCSSEVKINCNSTGNTLPSIDLSANLIEEKTTQNVASSNNVILSSQYNVLHLKPTKTTNPISKKERKKTKIQPGLGLKKKNIPSLVEKWQKIKEQQDIEDNDPDDFKSENLF